MTISDGKSGILVCDYKWTEYTPDGTPVTVVCGEPLQNIGEFNEICPYWNKHTEGSDLAASNSEPTQTHTKSAHPPMNNEVDIDTILEQYRNFWIDPHAKILNTEQAKAAIEWKILEARIEELQKALTLWSSGETKQYMLGRVRTLQHTTGDTHE